MLRSLLIVANRSHPTCIYAIRYHVCGCVGVCIHAFIRHMNFFERSLHDRPFSQQICTKIGLFFTDEGMRYSLKKKKMLEHIDIRNTLASGLRESKTYSKRELYVTQ